MDLRTIPSITFEPIGIFESKQIAPYEAGFQPDSRGLTGVINLRPGKNFDQALEDLSDCSHIWIIYHFHNNTSWKPLVQPPRANRKIGVFATRAPYRPNPIGISVVKLVEINGLSIVVGENDILNNTPILDIKPYHPQFDIVTDATINWLENSTVNTNHVTFSPFAEKQLSFLESKNLITLRSFILRQLEYDPINSTKKRVISNLSYHTLSFQTWRIDFSFVENLVGVLSIRSGYTETELNNNEDPYKDKELHREFEKYFR